MKILFISAFIATFLATRLSVAIIPYSSTFTGLLRNKTKMHIHHIYIGLAILATTVPLLIFNKTTPSLVAISAIGLSFGIDELAAWVSFTKYPNKKEFIVTLSLYILLIAYFLLLP